MKTSDDKKLPRPGLLRAGVIGIAWSDDSGRPMPPLWTVMFTFCVVSLLLLAPAARADQPPMVFTHLSTADGLSQATVNAIHQDSQGFLWLGTENGLNRYDGNEIRRYYRERDKADGLASDFIRALDEDQDGNLWIATEGSGLVVWDRRSDSFSSYRHEPGNPASMASDYLRDVLVDRQGRIWVATRNRGLDRLDPATGIVTHFTHDPQRNGTLSSSREVHAVLQGSDGKIWVTTSAGLDQFVERNEGFLHYPLPASSGSNQTTLALAEDHLGDLWLGSFDAGLLHFDPSKAEFTVYRHSPDDPHSLPHDQVPSVFEDAEHRLWVGTGGGLSLFNRENRQFETYTNNRARPDSLAGNTVRAMNQDKHGLLWIGTSNQGASRWNSRSWSLGHRIPDWLPEASMINAFAEQPDGTRLFGTMVGLYAGKPGGEIEWVAGREELGDDMVMSLLDDSRGNLWIGTMAGGLSVRHADGRMTRYQAGDGSLRSNGIMGLFEDSDGLVWVGTFEGGVSVYDPTSEVLSPYDDTADTLPSFERTRATAIRQDSQGKIWVGTSGDGIFVIDRKGGQITHLQHDPGRRGSIASDTIYTLHVDGAGGLWSGTAGSGLDYVESTEGNPAQLQFENLSRAEGLANDVIYAVVEDAAGKLWLPSNNGLMQLDPESRSIRTYHTSHGAQSEEYSYGAYLKTSSGRLLFAGTQGYNEFDPEDIQQDNLPPQVVFTRIEIQNQPLESGPAVHVLREIELEHHENAISLEFAALDFADPARNQFSYRLAGFDPQWITLRNKRRVSYTNLPRGNYVFQVRAAGADSVWNEKGMQLAITVNPAPWQTWWAYTVYAVLACLAVFALYRQQTHRFRVQALYAKRLSREVEQRTQELHQRNQELAEASAAKTSFLARMSHEIRTPMNGVMGMTELLSATELNSRQEHYTQTISRSAASLLQIINDILDLSKIEAGHVELESRPFSMEQLVDDCLSLLAQQANTKGIELLASVDPQTPRLLLGDALRLQQVLTNLVGNALKFTADGEVLVTSRIQARDNETVSLRVEIRDTGIGIEESALAGIFEPFSQVDETTTRRFGGTGLGLPISRQLVELMGGRIGVRSVENVGTSFWCEFTLPVEDARPIADQDSAVAGLRILVLSPQISLREAIEQHLQALGASVIYADDDSAPQLDGISESDIDVLVLDADRVQLRNGAPSSWSVPRVYLGGGAEKVNTFTQPHKNSHWVTKPLSLRELVVAISEAAGKLPRTSTRDGEPATCPPVAKSAPTHRVLVVEDNQVNQLVAEGILTQLGYNVCLVSDGKGAINLVATEHFDAVLMDCQMPVMDGFEATASIRGLEDAEQRIPIIGLTAHASADSRDACLAAGMDDFLSKPYTAEELEAALSKWIGITRGQTTVLTTQDQEA